MSIDAVLALLADGETHSGEELGQALGVSRTAVWKQLKKLEDLGIRVHSVKGQGYRVEKGLELLDAERIREQLTPGAARLLTELDLCGSVDSTNTRALQRAQSGSARGLICLAEHQSAGRGRRGRQWVSPYGRNIYLSLVWEFTAGAAAMEGLSLAVGVAIVRALGAQGVDGVQLKWPNDVLWQGRKLAGVLLEMTGDAAGHCQVVVGVGINVAMLASEAKDIDQDWISLDAIHKGVSRNKLAADLLNHLLPMLANYQQQGFAPLREEWESLDCFGGREVEIHAGDTVTVGQVAGVSDTGALRLNTAAGEELIYGGEASLRRSSTP
ncbi:bifunctional biotin--[acetyl-CoA-carboxylase] ligase/biotin operon repressor BirA [Gilvimarinus sp. F26214L]|uniref:bifunctional biotin--[acetyl-CoA-carboxylase] ligase/biotin operon repressor BirA n=1 Tax=Gilvimarinus sp. DZF01 TaxID=3461371 RepID=UPI0040462BDD